MNQHESSKISNFNDKGEFLCLCSCVITMNLCLHYITKKNLSLFTILENALIGQNGLLLVHNPILQGLSKFNRGVLRPIFFFKWSLDM